MVHVLALWNPLLCSPITPKELCMDANPVKIAIHHRYPLICDCLPGALHQHFAADVLALPCAPISAQRLTQLVGEAKPDLLIVDLDAYRLGQPAECPPAAFIKAVRATCFGIKIIALSECQSFSFINALLCAGADAHLIPTCLSLEELFAGCEAVQAGALYLCRQSKRILLEAYPRSSALTTREIEIVRLLATHPNDQYQHLASLLHVTSGTMRTHLANLRLKLGVQSNHEMIDAVRMLGFIE
jgi:DNA-binding NarL/FixJ family response regulator